MRVSTILQSRAAPIQADNGIYHLDRRNESPIEKMVQPAAIGSAPTANDGKGSVIRSFTITAHLMKGLDFEETSLGLGLLILLMLLWQSFHAASDRPSLRQGLIVLVTAFAFTLAYGAVRFYLLDRHFHTSYNLIGAVRQTVIMFTAFYNPGPQPVTSFGGYFVDSICVIGLGVLGFALLMLIRPVLVRLLMK